MPREDGHAKTLRGPVLRWKEERRKELSSASAGPTPGRGPPHPGADAPPPFPWREYLRAVVAAEAGGLDGEVDAAALLHQNLNRAEVTRQVGAVQRVRAVVPQDAALRLRHARLRRSHRLQNENAHAPPTLPPVTRGSLLARAGVWAGTRPAGYPSGVYHQLPRGPLAYRLSKRIRRCERRALRYYAPLTRSTRRGRT
jgi:hypothetical protein